MNTDREAGEGSLVPVGEVYHLAQINTPRLRAPLTSEVMVEFVALIEEVNAAADASDGFIWRHEHPSLTEAHSIFDDEMQIANLSVWRDPESLLAYMRSAAHIAVMRRRKDWFLNQPGRATLALWWVQAGYRPSLADGEERLVYLTEHGPSDFAFDFRSFRRFPKPS